MATSPRSPSGGPLAGLRVLDLSWLLPGPYFTGMLADLGADVLKVERPGDGDYTRTLLPGMFQLANRGKRSAVVDLRSDAGCESVLRLAERADVFVEGFRPGVMARLGVGYEQVSARNRGIVYVSLSGYGQEGASAQEPGHDVNYCGRAGVMGIPTSVGHVGDPPRMQLPVSDIAGAMYAAVSTLAALRERDRTGEGQWLDVSLAQSALAWSAVRWADAPAEPAQRWKHVSAANDVFTTSDGARLGVALVEEHFWEAFVAGLDAPQRDRIATAGHTPEGRHEVLRNLFSSRSAVDWMAYAKAHDLPISRIATRFEDIAADPLFCGRDAWIAAAAGQRPMPAFPVAMRGAPRHAQAPEFGEASDSLATLWEETR
jgi:crotonobetainyl-CoA:carnitine CoA-transferase CaiB-like acyl-CoA transferase